MGGESFAACLAERLLPAGPIIRVGEEDWSIASALDVGRIFSASGVMLLSEMLSFVQEPASLKAVRETWCAFASFAGKSFPFRTAGLSEVQEYTAQINAASLAGARELPAGARCAKDPSLGSSVIL